MNLETLACDFRVAKTEDIQRLCLLLQTRPHVVWVRELFSESTQPYLITEIAKGSFELVRSAGEVPYINGFDRDGYFASLRIVGEVVEIKNVRLKDWTPVSMSGVRIYLPIT